MGVVTYNGPKDKADPSNRYRVPREGNEEADTVLRVGVPNPDVPARVEKVLKSKDVADKHDFDFGSSGGSE